MKIPPRDRKTQSGQVLRRETTGRAGASARLRRGGVAQRATSGLKSVDESGERTGGLQTHHLFSQPFIFSLMAANLGGDPGAPWAGTVLCLPLCAPAAQGTATDPHAFC